MGTIFYFLRNDLSQHPFIMTLATQRAVKVRVKDLIHKRTLDEATHGPSSLSVGLIENWRSCFLVRKYKKVRGGWWKGKLVAPFLDYPISSPPPPPPPLSHLPPGSLTDNRKDASGHLVSSWLCSLNVHLRWDLTAYCTYLWRRKVVEGHNTYYFSVSL